MLLNTPVDCFLRFIDRLPHDHLSDKDNLLFSAGDGSPREHASCQVNMPVNL